ncbi:MAG: carboxypeptidase-like regulatory domain-containing protein [Dehalococcoidales bacterium]|nr:carboxypeptidase-like regulatory domain-containing protein [Dehalococcoidales bacterium]
MVYDEAGEKLVWQVTIDCNGRYSVELEPGTYTVDINRLGIDFAKGLPQQVEIESGVTTRLDVDIDTGIR